MTVAEEGALGDHHGVAEATKMGAVLELFGEEVGGVDLAGDVGDGDPAVGMNFADLVLPEIDVLDPLVGDRGGPVDGALIVVVDSGGGGDVGHTEIFGAVADVDDLGDACVRRDDLSLAGTESSLILADGLPRDGAAATANDKAAEGAKLEELEGRAVGDGVAELSTPAGVAEGRETVTVGRGRGRSIRVGLTVMVRGEVVEGLDGLRGVAVEGDPILAGGVEILEGVDGGAVVLGGGGLHVRCQERQARRDVGARARGEPVQRAHDALIDFGAAGQVGVVGRGRGDGIDWERDNCFHIFATERWLPAWRYD